MDGLSRHICTEPRSSRPRRAFARERGLSGSDCSREFLSPASPRQMCRAPSLPFAILKPFHPQNSPRPRSSAISHPIPAALAPATPSRRISSRRTGPRVPPAFPIFFPFPSLCTCVLFPTLPKIIEVKVWCLEAVSRRQGVLT